MDVRFLIDEHIDHAIAVALRLRSYDVLTLVDAHLLGADDLQSILPFALAESRVLVSADDVRAITLEHARDLASILFAIGHLRDCIAWGIEPGSGKAPRRRSQREAIVQRLTAEIARLNRHYDDAVAAFVEGFGFEAAEALDLFVRLNCQGALTQSSVSVQLELF